MLTTPHTFAGGLRLQHRIVKAAMTERLAGPDGAPTERLVRLFERFAQGGAALMLTGNVAVDSRHLEALGNVTLDTAHALAPFRAWARAGRRHGVPLVMQINHPGRQAMRVVDAQPVAPSAVALPSRRFFALPRAMSEDEIQQVIRQFVRAAQVAAEAGFAGVQVHAAHGYLLNQFLSPRTNLRTDRWGGALPQRARLLLEIVERIRSAVPAGFAVGVKLNAADYVQGGLEPDDAVAVAALLRPLRPDFVEVSGGTFERAASFGRGVPAGAGGAEGYFRAMAARIRAASDASVILTGGLRSAAGMEAALREGCCDLVGLARPLAVRPDLPRALLRDPHCAAVPPRLRLPRGPVAPLAELCWYGEQLQRIADGKPPRNGGSALLPLIRKIVTDRWRAWRRRAYLARQPARPRPDLQETRTP